MTDHECPSGAATGEPAPRLAESTVPDLIGLSLEQACEAAAWAGIKLNATSSSGLGRVGVVVGQSPPPGTIADPLGQINVSISAPWPTAQSMDATRSRP